MLPWRPLAAVVVVVVGVVDGGSWCGWWCDFDILNDSRWLCD